MVFTQPPPHHHQQQRDQHEAQIPGNCAKLAAEEFATLGKIAEVQQQQQIPSRWCTIRGEIRIDEIDFEPN